jgi:hypothetical protein
MALIDDVKPRIGVYYSDTNKDLEVQGMIDGAIDYFKDAGWVIDGLAPTPLAKEAIILYCKMAQSTDPELLINHPVLMSFIAQRRGAATEEVVTDEV